MKFSLILLILFTFHSYILADDYIPNLDELKRLHLEGTNGQYSLGKLNSIYASGRILFYSDSETIERGFRIYKKRPNKYRSFYETKLGNKIVQLEVIFDGESAIQIFSHDSREVYREVLEGESLDQVVFESKLEGPFLLLMDENKRFLSIAGYEHIDGEKCILLNVDERSKYPYRNIWLDSETYQEIKYDRYVSKDGQEQLEEVYYRNFKNKYGVPFPSRIDKFTNGKRSFTTFIDDFNVNYGLYDSLFDLNLN